MCISLDLRGKSSVERAPWKEVQLGSSGQGAPWVCGAHRGGIFFRGHVPPERGHRGKKCHWCEPNSLSQVSAVSPQILVPRSPPVGPDLDLWSEPTELRGAPWSIRGAPWSSMEHPRSSVELHGAPTEFRCEVCCATELRQSSRELRGVPRSSVERALWKELWPGSSVELRGVLWKELRGKSSGQGAPWSSAEFCGKSSAERAPAPELRGAP